MAKETININEADVRKMVSESVDKCIEEGLLGSAFMIIRLVNKYKKLYQQFMNRLTPEQKQKIREYITQLVGLANGGGSQQGGENIVTRIQQFLDGIFSQFTGGNDNSYE